MERREEEEGGRRERESVASDGEGGDQEDTPGETAGNASEYRSPLSFLVCLTSLSRPQTLSQSQKLWWRETEEKGSERDRERETERDREREGKFGGESPSR